jgi:hypothetical protein
MKSSVLDCNESIDHNLTPFGTPAGICDRALVTECPANMPANMPANKSIWQYLTETRSQELHCHRLRIHCDLC